METNTRQTSQNRSAPSPLLAAALRKEKTAMKKYQTAERLAERARRRAEKLFKKFMEAYTARYRSEAANDQAHGAAGGETEPKTH